MTVVPKARVSTASPVPQTNVTTEILHASENLQPKIGETGKKCRKQ